MNFQEISISGEKIFELFGFPITSTLFLILIIGALISILFYAGMKKKELAPKSLQNFIEFILEKIFDFIDGITRDRKKTEEIFPLAASLFILILTSNLLGILPGLGIFSFLRSPSSDLNFTLSLSLASMVFVHILAVKRLGIFSHLKKFFNFSNPISFFVGILEGLSEITRVISLAVRLFGNLFAGEILLIITSSLAPYLLPLPFLLFEMLVAFIQSFIFFSLVVVFYVNAVSIEEAH